MLHDEHIREIHDFGNANDCFPGVAIEGGVCYFLWDRDNKGLCKVYSHSQNKVTAMSERPLLEKGADVFIRYNEVISIIRKVASFNEQSFSNIVSPRNPYYFRSPFEESISSINTCKVLGVESGKRLYKNVDKLCIERNKEELLKYKIFISKADGAAGQIGYPVPARILGKTEIAGIDTACTETFLRIGPFESEQECKNVKSYIETKFFRCLVGARKNKNMTQSTYSFVPLQDFSKPWTDEELYAKYGLTEEEIAFIESMIKPME
jgi:site-specific DNA-methyltransferase (adenine-specific)